MDQSTQQLIDKFKHNPAMAQALLQSLDGQRLMQMLTSQDGGAALNHAAQNAAAKSTGTAGSRKQKTASSKAGGRSTGVKKTRSSAWTSGQAELN